ncbi:hypothetical protein ES703_69086 [subsurface metagenome]
MSQIVTNRSTQILLAVVTLLAMAGASPGAEYYLRADTTTKIMPDGQTVVMWGFALDSAFGGGICSKVVFCAGGCARHC